jgi:hypothetical protein
MLDTTQWIAIAAVLALVIIVVMAVVASKRSHGSHAQLKRQFGPEYERVVQQHGSVARAEQELRERHKRVHSSRVHPLSEEDRARFATEWEGVQTRFVDDPTGAVTVAEELITQVMLARGYSRESVEHRDVDLSVEHAAVVEHYRAAHALAQESQQGRANTEDLRQALVHYRALFADLLRPQPANQHQRLQEARA